MTGSLIIDRDVDLAGAERATAWFSQDRTYRYLLTRTWDVLLPSMVFVMLNPSTADALTDDPTVTRCAGFARREGCGRIEVVNLFALRATNPRALWDHPDPFGPDNNGFLEDAARLAGGLVVAAWGASVPVADSRDLVVVKLFAKAGVDLHCLGVTKAGHPRHPLYVRADAPLIRWEVPS